MAVDGVFEAAWARADAEVAAGDVVSALATLQAVLPIEPSTDDPAALDTRRRLAELHHTRGAIGETRRELEVALAAGTARHGDAHPLMLAVRARLAAVASELNQPAVAAHHFGVVARIGPEVLGQHHPAVRVARTFLARAGPPSPDAEPEATDPARDTGTPPREPVYVPDAPVAAAPAPDGETSPRNRPAGPAPRAGPVRDRYTAAAPGVWERPLWTPPPAGHRDNGRIPGALRSDTSGTDLEDDIGPQTHPSAPADRPSGTTWHMSWAEAASAREAPEEEPWAGTPDPTPPQAVPMRVAMPPPVVPRARARGGTRHIKLLFGAAVLLLLAGLAVHAAFG